MRDERPGGEEAQAARLGGDVEAGATQRSTRYERRQPDDGQVEPRTRRLVPDLTDQTHIQTDTSHVVPHTHTHMPHAALTTQRYGLRPRVHDRTLPERSSNFVDCNFIIRMLYLNAY